MNRQSIAFKLFCVTTVFFTIFLLLTMVGQSLFFEKFYISKKISKTQKNLQEFTEKYAVGDWDENQINMNISAFTEKNNAQVAVLDPNGVVKQVNAYEIDVKTETGNQIKIPLNNISDFESLEKMNLKVGMTISAEGIFLDSEKNLLGLYSIEANNHKWRTLNESSLSMVYSPANVTTTINAPKEAAAVMETEAAASSPLTAPELKSRFIIRTEPANTIQVIGIKEGSVATAKPAVIALTSSKITGKIVQLNLPSDSDFLMPYRMNLLLNAAENWFWMSKSKEIQMAENKLIKYTYKDSQNGVENIIFISPIFKNNQLNEMLLVMTSLQPVNEAVEAMQGYYIYVFLAAAAIIVFMALLYSKMIARPLININRVAVKLSQLDFSEQLAIQSKDEIGSLSQSINSLSINLKDNIDQLKQANQKLQEDIEKERALERMRKEFVSGVSHELKTPLSIIKSFAEGIKDGISRDKEARYLDTILDESEKMSGLVHDMLELSKLESGMYKLIYDDFSISSLVAQTVEKLSHLAGDKQIQIALNQTEKELWVKADMRKIEQVLTNLLSNAVQYTKLGGKVQVVILNEANQARISIENYGEHIPEDKLDKIWDRFYKVDESRDRKNGGTGLGLSIVKNTLQLHDSRYGVYNTTEGVCFYFYLNLI